MLRRGVRQHPGIFVDRGLVECVVLVDVPIALGIRVRIRERGAPTRIAIEWLLGREQQLVALGLDAGVANQQRAREPRRRIAPGLRTVLPEVAVGIAVAQREYEAILALDVRERDAGVPVA